jgi:hypothetical protein
LWVARTVNVPLSTAVKRPLALIVPPVAVHTTFVVVTPLIRAENCCVPPNGVTLAEAGDTVKVAG